MAVRLTPKQEAFVRVYLETGNATAAYRQAYDCSTMKNTSIWREAKAMLDHPKITLRLEELQKPAAHRAMITLASHLEELARLRDRAVQAGQYGAAVAAEQHRGKAAGFYRERADLAVRTVEDHNDEQLLQLAHYVAYRAAAGGASGE
jgi:phage terminase small subunit